jgi:tetratricopeptide (TPR) repeat protein
MYLPLATLIVLAVCLSHRAWSAVRSRAPVMPHLPTVVAARGGAAAAAVLTVMLSGLLATATMARNREFETPLTLARVTAERRPHGRAYYALAHELNERGRRAEAMTLFARATTDFPPARFAFGTELLARGEIERGIEELRTFVSLAPLHPAVAEAHQMIGTAYFDQRRYADAAAELALTLELEPRHVRAQALLGEILLLQRRGAEAVEHLQRAVSLQPAQVRTRELLGHALAIEGRYADAERRFREVLHLDARHAGARAALRELERIFGGPAADADRQRQFRR